MRGKVSVGVPCVTRLRDVNLKTCHFLFFAVADDFRDKNLYKSKFFGFPINNSVNNVRCASF